MKSIFIILATILLLVVACGQTVQEEKTEGQTDLSGEDILSPGQVVVDENCTINEGDWCSWTNNGDGTATFSCDDIPINFALNRVGEAYWQQYATCDDAYKTNANMAKVTAYEIERWIATVTLNTERENNIANADVEPDSAWT